MENRQNTVVYQLYVFLRRRGSYLGGKEDSLVSARAAEENSWGKILFVPEVFWTVVGRCDMSCHPDGPITAKQRSIS